MSNCALIIHLKNGGDNAIKTINNLKSLVDKCLYFDLSSADNTPELLLELKKSLDLPIDIISEKDKKYGFISYDRMCQLAQRLKFTKSMDYFWYAQRNHTIVTDSNQELKEQDIKYLWEQIKSSSANKFAICDKNGHHVTVIYKNIDCLCDVKIFEKHFDINKNDEIDNQPHIIKGFIINN